MRWGALWIVVLEMLLLPPVVMGKRPPSCVRVCRPAVQACIKQGGRPARCRKSFRHRCRQLGTGACLLAPATTTTTTPPGVTTTTTLAITTTTIVAQPTTTTTPSVTTTTLAITTTTTTIVTESTTTTLPVDVPRCGNGKREKGEACDGQDFGNDHCGMATAESGGGTLHCAADCSAVDRSGCFVCGNGKLDGAFEICDGKDFGSLTCADFGGSQDAEHGLVCNRDCTTISESDCLICGNGRVDPGEECDLGLVNGKQNEGCTKECKSLCGDGIVQRNEQCDDANTVSDDGCSKDCLVEDAVGGGTEGDTPATPPIDRCYAAWRVLRVPPGTDAVCQDGTACDPNDGPGVCTFDFVVCFNATQFGPGTCTPTAGGLTAVSSKDGDFLAAVQGALGGTIKGETLALPKVTTLNRCVTAEVKVATESPQTLVVTTRDADVEDVDAITFTCAP